MTNNTPAPADLVEAVAKPFNLELAQKLMSSSRHQLPLWMQKEAVEEIAAHRRAAAIGKVEITEAQSKALHEAVIASCDEVSPPQPDPRDAEIERLRQALKLLADEMTCEEIMNNPLQPDWGAMTVEDRIKYVGARKMERDIAILTARAALAK